MTTPLVSILIPVYNRIKQIKDTLDSAINQTYDNYEIIIRDNRSDDGTWEFLSDYTKSNGKIKLYQNDFNVGPVINWMKLVQQAKGEYIKILFSDDLIEKDFINKMLPILIKNNSVSFCCSAVEIIQDSEVIKTNHYFKKTGKVNNKLFIKKILLGGNVSVSASHALFRKEDLLNSIVLDVPNKINSDFKMHGIGPDALMFLLIANKYKYFYYIDDVLAKYTAHDQSISVKTKSAELILLHILGRAYYVENYCSDKTIIKKFNARIKINLILYKDETDLLLSDIDDFYMGRNEHKYNRYYYVVQYLLVVLIPYIKKLIKRFLKSTFLKRI